MDVILMSPKFGRVSLVCGLCKISDVCKQIEVLDKHTHLRRYQRTTEKRQKRDLCILMAKRTSKSNQKLREKRNEFVECFGYIAEEKKYLPQRRNPQNKTGEKYSNPKLNISQRKATEFVYFVSIILWSIAYCWSLKVSRSWILFIPFR